MDWLCAWGYFVCVNDQNMRTVELQWNLGDCESSFLLNIALLSPHHDWLATCILGDSFDTWWYFILAGRTFFLLEEGVLWAFTGSACEACFAAMKISIRTCMSWYFIMFLLWYRIQQFPSKSVRALHCHDNWGFTSLSTLMIYRLLVVFLYLFLNILCGYLVVSVSLSLD